MTKKKRTISIKAAEAMRATAIKRTPALCRTLAAIAALNFYDNHQTALKIYETIRILQILADLPPMPPKK